MRKIFAGFIIVVVLIISAAYFFLFSRPQQNPPETKSAVAPPAAKPDLLASEEDAAVSEESEQNAQPDTLHDAQQRDISETAKHLYLREQKLGVVAKPEHPLTFDLKAHIPSELQKNQ